MQEHTQHRYEIMNLLAWHLSSSMPQLVVNSPNNRKRQNREDFIRIRPNIFRIHELLWPPHEITKSKVIFPKCYRGMTFSRYYQKLASTHFLVHFANFQRYDHSTSITYQRNTYLIGPASQTAIIIVLVITFTRQQ